MRTLGGLGLALLVAGGLSAQNRGNYASTPRGAPSGVNSGGSRTGGNAARQPRYGSSAGIYIYTYPIYVPMTGALPYVDPTQAAPAQDAGPAQAPPNVVVVYASQPPQSPAPETAHPSMQVYDSGPAPQPADETPAPTSYLFAFKDHSIYSAVAYWVDGETLHYFTTGSTHKQVPLSSLDRDLTERLNQESGADLKLPPARNQ